MGFNFGSFAAGALKTLSENVKEQSDEQDKDAKRYLEAGIAEGKAATKLYRAENKALKELGSQLDSQLDNENSQRETALLFDLSLIEINKEAN